MSEPLIIAATEADLSRATNEKAQYVEVEMSPEMRDQVLGMCRLAYDKGLADASKLDEKRIQLAYDNGWRAGYTRGFHVGLNAAEGLPTPGVDPS